jgi:phage protein D
MPDIPTSNNGYVFQLVISINDEPLSKTINVVSATVVKEMGKPGHAEVAFLDGDPAVGAFALSSGDDFDLGNTIQIAVGYGDDTAEIFNGVISGQTLNAGDSGYPQLTILATSATDQSLTSNALKPAVLSVQYGANMLSFNATQSKQGRKSIITGEMRSIGSHLLKPGETLEIKGVGDRFTGNAIITGMKHVIEGGNWFTTAQFKR